MSLSKFDRANLNRLKACVKPNETKIEKLKSKLRKFTEETIVQINYLEAQNNDFNALIADLESRESIVETIESSEEAKEESFDVDFPNDEQLNEMPY